MSGSQDHENSRLRIVAFLRQPWMKSASGWKFNLLAGLLLLLAGLISFDARDNQWQERTANEAFLFADGSPLVSSNDAGYFLAHARDYQENRFDFDHFRNWPDNTDGSSLPQDARDIPLLSVIIAELADMFHDGDLLMAGNAMLPFTAFLTAFAIGLAFWAAGFPAEGALAGLGTCLSFSYFARTSIGRIDTDQLILFFIALILAAILLASRQKDWPRRLIFIVLAAGLFHLFKWWYDRDLFIFLFPGIVFAVMLTARLRFGDALISACVFLLLINPVDFIQSLVPVVIDSLTRLEILPPELAEFDSTINFPDTFETISELEKSSLLTNLEHITGSSWLGLAGIAGAGIWMVLFPAPGMAFLPFAALGLMSGIVGQRFAFYAAPVLWFGLGWLFLSFIRLLQQGLRRRHDAEAIPARDGFVPSLPVLAGGFIALLSTATFLLHYSADKGLAPIRPAYSPMVVNGFAQLGKLDQGRGGVIATWWDYGYIAHFKSGLATLHDPGGQRGPRTYLIGHGLIQPDPDLFLNTLRFIAQKGGDGISAHGQTAQDLSEAIASIAQTPMPDHPIYIVLTGQMTGNWLDSIARLGLHDTFRDLPPSPALLQQYRYYNYNCQQTGAQEMRCGDERIDLEQGTINGQPVLSLLVQSENGFAQHAKDYQRPDRYTLLIEKMENAPDQIYIISPQMWRSSFNQLYRLGLFNTERLKLILDHYPQMRVFEVLR